MPHDLPPWQAAYQQTRRWLEAGVFEAMVHDLPALLRLSGGRASDPTATMLDSRTLQSTTPESGFQGDYERLPTTLAGLHSVAFACLFLHQATVFSAWVHNTL
jgi:transposase